MFITRKKLDDILENHTHMILNTVRSTYASKLRVDNLENSVSKLNHPREFNQGEHVSIKDSDDIWTVIGAEYIHNTVLPPFWTYELMDTDYNNRIKGTIGTLGIKRYVMPDKDNK